MKMRLAKIFFRIEVVAFALISCHNQLDDYSVNSRESGDQSIQFSVVMNNDPLTRTAYSGKEYDTPEGRRKERIDWSPEDEVKIFMSKYVNWNWESYEKVYKVANINSKDEKSIGQVTALDTELEWSNVSDDKHYFFSVYPADFSGVYNGYNEWNPWNDTYNLPLQLILPKKQFGDLKKNMQYAYMAAAGQQEYYTPDEEATVVLDYYPMITTVYVTLVNKHPKEESITLTKATLTSDISLAGKYPCSFDKNLLRFIPIDDATRITDDENSQQKGPTAVTINFEDGEVLRYGESADIAFFICPIEQNTESMNLSITTIEQGTMKNSIGNVKIPRLLPQYKYNITINLEGDTWDWEYPEDDNAFAQLVLAVLYGRGGLERTYPYLRDFFAEYFDLYSESEVANSNWWNNFMNRYQNTPFDQMANLLKEYFPGEQLKALFETLSTLTEVYIGNGTPGIASDELTEYDFGLFKSARIINIMAENPTNPPLSIRIKGLNNLEEIVFDGNRPIDITVEDCPEFKYISKINHTRTINPTIINCSNYIGTRDVSSDNYGENSK